MPRKSAGILLYHRHDGRLHVLLVHPGGPYHADKDLGAWSIPKGEYSEEEDPLTAAQREFREEIGQPVPAAHFMPLSPVKQKGGKIVSAWAAEGWLDVTHITSNTFPMEYPYKSGNWIRVPEVDRAAWFDTAAARHHINPAQAALVDELEAKLAGLTH